MSASAPSPPTPAGTQPRPTGAPSHIGGKSGGIGCQSPPSDTDEGPSVLSRGVSSSRVPSVGLFLSGWVSGERAGGVPRSHSRRGSDMCAAVFRSSINQLTVNCPPGPARPSDGDDALVDSSHG